MNKRALLQSATVLTLFAGLTVGTVNAADAKRIMVYGNSNSWGWIPVEMAFLAPATAKTSAGRAFCAVNSAMVMRSSKRR